MRFWIFSLFIIGSCTKVLLAENQKIDSLKLSLSNKSEFKRNVVLYELSKSYLFEDVDSSFLYINQLLDESKGAKDSVNMANGYNLLGIYYFKQYINHKAFYNFHKAAQLFLISKDTVGLAKCYNNMGIILKKEKDYEKAMAYYQKSLKYHRLKSNTSGIASSYQSIAILHKNQEMYDSAAYYQQKSIKIHQNQGNTRSLMLSYLNYGNLLRYMGQKDSCFYYLNKTIELRKQSGNQPKVLKAYTLLAKCYFAFGQIDSAKKYAELVLDSPNIKLKRDACEILATIYEELGEYQKSVSSYKFYINVRDSLEKAEEVSNILQQERVFALEIKAKERELKQAEALKQLTRKQNIQYLLIIVVIALAFVLFFVFGLSKVKPIIINPFIVILLLMTFEFILVYTEPYVDDVANNNPGVKLGINMMIALVLIPMHNFLDRLMKKKTQ